MKMQIIPKEKFTKAFENLGWENYISSDDKYVVWTYQNHSDLWTLVPRNERVGEYLKYQEQNIYLILLSLNLPDTQENFWKIYEQLLELHYPIVSRFTSKENKFDDGIPIDLADVVLNKISHSFMDFRKTFQISKTNNLRLGHTQQGSFVFKILVPIEEEQGSRLFNTENLTKTVIREYLDNLDKLSKIETVTPKKYAEKVLGDNIPVHLVESFLGRNGIVGVTKKYIEDDLLDTLFIKSENNDLLEFNSFDKKEFKNIDLSVFNTLDDNFIKQIKDIENSSEIDLKGAEIIGSLFEINDEGKAKFIVEKINGIDKRDKPDFKNINQIQTSELTDEWRTMCYLSGAKRRKLQITGDLSKKNGKAAKVIVGKLDFYEPLESPNLFN
jgi:hypothetical protein